MEITMTDAEKLEYLTALSKDEKDQEVLTNYLHLAETVAFARVFPFGCEDEEKSAKVMQKYDRIICEIAVYLVNKRGAEGEKAHNESTAERQYENGGVPDSILKRLIPYCGVL